jgi:hypothetical protein
MLVGLANQQECSAEQLDEFVQSIQKWVEG